MEFGALSRNVTPPVSESTARTFLGGEAGAAGSLLLGVPESVVATSRSISHPRQLQVDLLD